MRPARSIVMCFAGQGSQYRHMGADLMAKEPAFRASLERSDALVGAHVGRSPLAAVLDAGRSKADAFDDVVLTNPAILMMELALLDLMDARDIRPDIVLGASLGEFAAAVASGVLDAPTALRLACDLGVAVARDLPGGMLAVLAPAGLYDEEPALHAGTEIAGISSDAHFVVSGHVEALEAAERALAARKVPYQRVAVRHAFHSRLMEPLRTRLLERAAGIAFAAPRLPVYSSATAGRIARMDAAHFWSAARLPIRFADAVAAVEETGPHLYLDLSPSGGLHNHLKSNLAGRAGSLSLPLMSPFADSSRLVAEAEAACRRLAPARRPTPLPEDTMLVYGFPGQGSQVRGMQGDLFRRFPGHVARADAVLGYSIEDLCANDPDGRLRETRYTQPALYVVECLSYLARREDGGAEPAFVAGHSIGEYAALFAADVFDFETGLDLVRRRGELMGGEMRGGMAAVIGAERATVRATLEASGLDDLDIAAHNNPTQVVLAGALDALARARPVFEARGATFVPLNVSAAFHSRHMRGASEAFRARLAATAFREPRFPVIANTDARPHRRESIAASLAEQIVATVEWVDTVRWIMAQGPFTFEELGPGTTLTRTVDSIRKALPPLDVPRYVPPPRIPATPPAAAPATRPDPGSVPAPEPVSAPAASTPVPPPVAAEAGEPDRPRLPNGPAGPAAPSPDALPSARATAAPAVAKAAPFGAAGFRSRWGLEHACVVGALHGGISGPDMLVRLARHGGSMGFFGSAGLPLETIEAQLAATRAELGTQAVLGANLAYEAQPAREAALVDLYLRLGVDAIDVSGFPKISPALVAFRAAGGRILAKVSSLEASRAFLLPPPEALLRDLVERGAVAEARAREVSQAPMATDLCVEGETGWTWSAAGVLALLPAVVRLRDALAMPGHRVHVGASGGIGTPAAVAAVAALGAEFVVLGSVAQCTVEAATSEAAKDMLARMSVTDVEIAPFGPLFEYGVRTRVLKKGVFFPARANRLYGLWREHGSAEALPEGVRRDVERTILGRSFAQASVEAAPHPSPARDGSPKGRLTAALAGYCEDALALARRGDPDRRVDYAIPCGPALGALNETLAGTPLAPWRERHVERVVEAVLGIR